MILEILMPFWLYLDSLLREIKLYSSSTFFPFENLITQEEFKKIESELEIKNLISDLTISFFLGQEIPSSEKLKILSRTKDAESFLLYFYAIIEIRKGNLIKAQIFLEDSIKLNPNFDFAWNLLGYLQSNAQNYKEALISFKKAVELNPYQPVYRFNLAKTYLLLNDKVNSLQEIQVAIQLKDNFAEAYFIKGILLEEINHLEALKNFEIALQNGLNTEEFLIRFTNLAFQYNQIQHLPTLLEKINNYKESIEVQLLQLKIFLFYGEQNKALQVFLDILSLPSTLYDLYKEKIHSLSEKLKVFNCKYKSELKKYWINNQKKLIEDQSNLLKTIINSSCDHPVKLKDPILNPMR
ncbi:MAG: tetratricopeptide repeat protein [Leptonema sp. (in: bacteria)]